MAKKVTITGTNLLTTLAQAWGGTADSATTIYGTPVPAGAEWGVNKAEVERFIKSVLSSLGTTKAGDFRWHRPSDSNYFYLLLFATKGDAEEWDADNTLENYIARRQLPISAVQSDSYVAQLRTSRSTSTQYLMKDGDSFEVPLRFNAIYINGMMSTQEYISAYGVLTVERSVNGTTYTEVSRQTISASMDDEGFPITLDLKGLLVEGSANYIRLRASYDNNGDTITSTPLILTINSVSLALEMSTAWHEPMINPSALALQYTVRGSVQRTLHLKVTGSLGTYETSQSLTAAQTTASFSLPEVSAYGLLTHGVKTCEAWLSAGNSTVGELESVHLATQVMVVKTNDEHVMEPRLLIQQTLTKVGDEELLSTENFVQSQLLRYAVYSPARVGDVVANTGPAIPMSFLLTNSASSIITVPQTAYANIFASPAPGTVYPLNVTVEIEADGEALAAFLHATRADGTIDFLLESTGSGNIYVRVDNTGGFQPTAGATFLLNPKQRSNDEANPKTIVNAKNTSAVVASTWDNFRLGTEDGYVKDESGEACLRVPAGRTLKIGYNPLALLHSSPNQSLTIELDVCVRNVTNEDDPILRLAELVGSTWLGLRMRPMTGFFTTDSWNKDEECDFRWQEDVRTHIAVNIVNAVYPNAHGDALTTAEKAAAAQGSFPLVRVIINGVIVRELVYTPGVDEFCTRDVQIDPETGEITGGFVIGQDGADIDIYGIRVFERNSLTAEQILQDYLSTLPDSDKKREIKALNAIIDPQTGLIGLDYITGEGAVTGIKKNVLLWHGNEPYHENAHKNETGWIEVWRYDQQGNYLPELSGTICRETKSIPQKAQGTTAKTYYYHNIQIKINDAVGNITISPSDLHSSITAEWDGSYEWMDGDTPTGEVGAWSIKGGYLGKNFPLSTESAVRYHGTATSIIVPDGWIDGNGKYRGRGYQVAAGIPMAQKLVNKINYASSMQSHLIGINWLYNELHTIICGENTCQSAVDGAVVAKHTEPFLFFTQVEGGTRAVFRGPCAFGAGKMDKPSWGYVKSAHPDFCMIEGADNDKPLTDMRIPWDDVAHGSQPAKVFYDPSEEAFYARTASGGTEKCIDWDGGATDDEGYPKAAIVNYIRAAWNFLYMHAPRIRHYNGTLAEFLVDADYASRSISTATPEERERIEQAQARVKTANKYWCRAEGTTASGDFILKRYDFADGEWVDAGLWDGTAYGVIDVRYGLMANGVYVGDENDPYGGALAAAWAALTEGQKNQSDVVNKAVIDAIVAHARTNIGSHFKVISLKFHYAFQNHFIAGTDNCSKNTYYVLDPVTHLFEMHQDDVDTTLATDNSGLQSKPYFLDRMHPFTGSRAAEESMSKAEDLTPDNCAYEGFYNVLFDLCELMWEGTGDLQSMMRDIFSHMASLSGGIGSSDSATMGGVWKALNRYIFDIQRYFPQTVFNEAARIRYELPELIGFLSDIRNIHPIVQSMGDQLQAELQFMKRRLVYMASYAAFGEFSPTGMRNGLTGLAEATDSFGMQKYALPGSSSPSAYVFHLVPHQWIYPTGGRETNNLINPHVRVAPGATNMPNGYFEMNIDPGQASDLGVNVFGLNYYRELGNVGDMVANNGVGTYTLNGRRLTKFEAVPTIFYTEDHLPAFRVGNITIGTATRLKEFNVKGAVIGTGTLDLRALSLAQTIDLRETKITQVRVPETSTITTLKLPASLTAISLTAQPNLSALTFEGYGVLTQATVTGSPMLGTSLRGHVLSMMSAGAGMTLLNLDNIYWLEQAVEANVIRWLLSIGDTGVCLLQGRIAVVNGSDGLLTFDDTCRLIERYGNVRNVDNPLYVSFPGTPISAANMSIEGKKYINTDSASEGYDLDVNQCFGGLRMMVNSGNDVGVAVNGAGKQVPNVVWELTDDVTGVYAEFADPYSPVLHFIQIGSAVRGITLNVKATLTNTSGETRVVTKKIGLWNRIPEVGDYAWTDGQFDNQNDPSKQLAGMVIRKEAVYEGDTVVAYKLTILSPLDPTFPTSQVVSGSESSWGPYPVAGANGFSDAKTDGVYNDSTLEAIRQAVQTWQKPEGVSYATTTTFLTDIFDQPLQNITDSGYLRRDAEAVEAAGGGIAMQDANNAENGGYNTDVPNSVKNFATEEENIILMSYADTVLGAVYSALGITQQDFASIQATGGCTSSGIPLTTYGLFQIAELVVSRAQAAEVTYPYLYRQLLFMAARRCHVWSPSDIEGLGITEDNLHESYRRGKWMLPSSGILSRIFNFMANSRAQYNESSAPSSDYAEQSEGGLAPNVSLESQKPLFANAIARGRNIPISAGSYHWSSTECNRNYARFVNFNNGIANYNYKYVGYVVRPVAAFTFVP